MIFQAELIVRLYFKEVSMVESSIEAYDRQLKRVSEALLEMGDLVKGLVVLGKKALLEPNTDFVATAKATDAKVNALDAELESLAMTILALRQPMAMDLRIVTSSLKLSGYLETMGDLAKKVARKALQPDIALSVQVIEDFSKVADLVVDMLGDVLRALQNGDADAAVAVWKRDDEVDALYHDLYALLQAEIEKDTSHITEFMCIVAAAKSFERMGDYVSRIAKTVYYINSGERFEKRDFR